MATMAGTLEGGFKVGDKVKLTMVAMAMPSGVEVKKVIAKHRNQEAEVMAVEEKMEPALGTVRRWYKLKFPDGVWLRDIEEDIPPLGIKILKLSRRVGTVGTLEAAAAAASEDIAAAQGTESGFLESKRKEEERKELQE